LQVEQFDAKFWLINITALFQICWLMLFDANPTTIQVLGKKLRADPHLLRHTVIKLGSKLDDVNACPEKTF
jgi:ribosomal protein S6